MIFPYLYTRGISGLRKRTKPSWKKLLQKDQQTDNNNKNNRFRDKLLSKLQTFLKNHVHAIHLAVFYFYGAYYSLSKRATGIRYVIYELHSFLEMRLIFLIYNVNLFFVVFRYLQDNWDPMNNVSDMRSLDFYL